MELWALGYAGSSGSVPSFVGASTSSCFEMSSGYAVALPANKDDVYIVDRAGAAVLWGNLISRPLSTQANYDDLNAAIRAKL